MARNGCHVAFCQRVPARYAMYPSPICFRKLLNASIFVLPDFWEAPPLGDGSTNLSFWGDEHHFTFKSFAQKCLVAAETASFPHLCPSSRDLRKKSHVWLFDDVWRWPMFSDFSCFLSKFPTLPYLRKWTFQNGGHIYRAEVVVGRGRPLLCTLTATAAGRRGSGTTDPQRGGGKPMLVVQVGTWSIPSGKLT